MAKLSLFPTGQELDDNGDPLSGGFVYFYEAGTSTPKTAYTSEDESVALANPATLDADGRIEVWLGDGAYKIRLFDSDLNLIDERDNITGDSANTFGANVEEVSSNTLVTSAYKNYLIVGTGTINLTLLAAADAGEGFVFSVQNHGSGTITVDPDASETINGASTLTISAGTSAIIICDGSEWFALGTIGPNSIGTTELEDSSVTADKIEASQRWYTGDGKLTLSSTAPTGWVLANDGTIGNASSGGTTRANADTEDLFTLLWTNVSDTYAAVSGGRGASAAADFAADKTIALTKQLGRSIAIAGAGSGLTSRALGETLGAESETIERTHLPAEGLLNGVADDGGSTPFVYGTSTTDIPGTALVGTGPSGSPTVQGFTEDMGDGTALDIMNPTSYWNVMIKL